MSINATPHIYEELNLQRKITESVEDITIREEIDSLERQDADLLGQQGVGTDLIIVKKGDKYYFNVVGSFDSVKESVEIEFCPVCGRKLNGDLNCYNNYPLLLSN